MIISATVRNSNQEHEVTVNTNDHPQKITIPAKSKGYGSSVNGGELLFLSLATCFCNDVYREAAKRQMNIQSVEVSVTGEFGKEGEPGCNINYTVDVQAPHHAPEEIAALVQYVDGIAEVHNTLRKGVAVTLKA